MRRIVLAGLLVHFFTEPGFTESLPSYGKTFYGTLPGKPMLLPSHVRRPENLIVLDCVGDSLFEFKNGVHVPSLAKSEVVYEQDHLRAFVLLKKGVLDQNGRLLNPEDVVKVLEHMRQRLGNPLNVAKRVSWEPLDKKIVFEFSWPIDDLSKRLSMPETVLWRGTTADWAMNNVGPFQARSIPDKEGGSIRGTWVLEGYKKHHGGVPFLKQLVLSWTSDVGFEAKQYQNGHQQMSRFGKREHGKRKEKYKSKTFLSNVPSTLFLRTKNLEPEKENTLFLESLSGLIDLKKLETAGAYGTVKGQTLFMRAGDLSKRTRKRLSRLHGGKKNATDILHGILQGRKLVFSYRDSKPIHARLLEKLTFILHQKGVASTIRANAKISKSTVDEEVIVEMDEWVFDASKLEYLLRQLFSAQLSKKNKSLNKVKTVSLKHLKSRYVRLLPVLPLVDYYSQITLRSDVLGLDENCMSCFSDVHFYKRPRLN